MFSPKWLTEATSKKNANHTFYITYLLKKETDYFRSYKNCKKLISRFTNKFASNWTKTLAVPATGAPPRKRGGLFPLHRPRWLSCYHLSRVKTAPGNECRQLPAPLPAMHPTGARLFFPLHQLRIGSLSNDLQGFSIIQTVVGNGISEPSTVSPAWGK